MALSDDAFKVQIPYYLVSPPEQKIFLRELEALRSGASKGYYIGLKNDPYAGEMLQGDCWSGLQVYSFNSGAKQVVKGIVLSNSCDVSSDNSRAFPPKVVFAPVIKLALLEQRFNAAGLAKNQVEARVRAIKAQEVTSLFYLPAGASLSEDYVIAFGGAAS